MGVKMDIQYLKNSFFKSLLFLYTGLLGIYVGDSLLRISLSSSQSQLGFLQSELERSCNNLNTYSEDLISWKMLHSSIIENKGNYSL